MAPGVGFTGGFMGEDMGLGGGDMGGDCICAWDGMLTATPAAIVKPTVA